MTWGSCSFTEWVTGGPLHKGWDSGIEDFSKMPRLAGHSIIKNTGLEAHQECEHRKASMWTAVKSFINTAGLV